MKIPVKSGRTSLSYITDEERKLLRRRDAVKGSPHKKTVHGLPKLDSADYLADIARGKDLRAKEKVLMDAGFSKMMTGPGEEKYVHLGKGLSAGYLGAPSDTPIKYGSGPDEIRRFPGMGSVAATPKVEPIKVADTTPEPSTGIGGSSSSSRPTSPTPSTPSSPAPSRAPSTDAGSSDSIASAAIDPDQLQQPMLDEIVADGVNSELLENRLTNLINKNNPLFKAATTKTMQAMAARGLVNSSIAEEAVMSAILSVAMPIAERDANAYMNQRMQNQAYSNEFRAQQNQTYYQSFLQKLQHSMDMAMRQLVERSANWRAVLAQRGAIATQPGMGTSAAEAALGTVTPNWWEA
jgi:hypothetical protein